MENDLNATMEPSERLAQAAPDLYAALKELASRVELCDTLCDCDEEADDGGEPCDECKLEHALALAHAALAKAEGGAS